LAVWCDIDPEELSAFIDGEVTPDRASLLAGHVAACPSCRAELDRARHADDAVRGGGPEPALSKVRASLLDRTDAIRARAKMRRVLSPAAALAAAVVIGWQIFQSGSAPVGPAPEPMRPVPPRAPAIEALELDAASLRLTLVAENPDPAVRQFLDARLDAIVNRIEKLRSHN
jgi:anti-sigma factor RsiW